LQPLEKKQLSLDQQSLFTPITKKTWTVKNSKIIPNVMGDAFSLAMKPRRGPVCVNLPRNILAATNKYKIDTDKPSFESENSLKGWFISVYFIFVRCC
jgi:thiamine pyrophosphate-dependent acetolactate synthase large subunit-like protein